MQLVKLTEFYLFIFQLELLAIVFLCDYFADYILDRKIHTDSKDITHHLRTMRNLDLWTSRVLLKLQDYNNEFVHISGSDNFVADTLSRFPPEPILTLSGEFSVMTSLVIFHVLSLYSCLLASRAKIRTVSN